MMSFYYLQGFYQSEFGHVGSYLASQTTGG